MKKLLLIVACAFLVAANIYAAETIYTHTINVYSYVEGGSTHSTTGGTVALQGGELGKKISKYYFSFDWTDIIGYDSFVSGTTQEYKVDKEYTIPIINLGLKNIPAGYKIYADAEEGYYFAGWYDTSSGTGTPKYTLPEQEISLSIQGTKKTFEHYAIFKKQTVHRDYAKVVAIYLDEEGIPVFTGDITNPSSIVFTQGGGYVNINAATTNKTEVEYGDYNTLAYRDESEHTWNYTYYATSAASYAFAGWYDEATLIKQMKDNAGKLLLDQQNEATHTFSYTSNYKGDNAADIPVAPTMYAVFRPSKTYWHKGVSVDIAGYESERAEKGWVFADDGTYGTVDAVEDANVWVPSLHDETAYSQVDDVDYTYTYYAKASDPAKYAFKGWTRTPFGAVEYEGSETNRVLKDYVFTMTDDNTSEETAYPTPTLYAVFESFFYKCPSVAVADNSRGGGFVYVSLAPASITDCTQEEIAASVDLQQVAATGNSHPYTVYYYAKKADGATFVGWSTTPDGLSLIPNSMGRTEYSVAYESQNKSKSAPHVAPPLYAVFKHDFDIRQQDRMIVYEDENGNTNINDAKVLIDFQKGNTLTATLSGVDASYFTLSNRSGSRKGNSITFDATQGLIEMVVAYQGDLAQAVGKKAEITLSATYGEYTDGVTRKVTITVEQAPLITFLPTDGKGSYTIKMTNGSGINYAMRADTKENIKVQITHESMSNLEMNLTSDISNDDYRFFGWQMIDGTTTTYLSYDDLVNYQFTKSVTVRPEFIHNSAATYSIVGDETNTPYHDFALVMNDAKDLAASMGVSQTVVLNDSWKGTTITEGVLPKGNYTIPSGVNLLIPGDAAHTYHTNLTRDAGDFLNQSGLASSEHIRWIVEEGTNITVQENANILVYSRIITYGNDDNGRPYQYGHIELKENCKLDFLNGSNLYVYGYITGPLTSEITMNSGSTVKEVFQVKDWRGGTATSAIVLMGKGYKVFLVGQYYVQNVEVPLIIRKGAQEILEAGISDLADMDANFITSDNSSSFFMLGDGTWVKKYYDPFTDRMCFIGSKDEGATGEIQLGSVTIDAGIAKVNSADYILPIPSNYDIKIQGNLSGTFSSDYAFMPGSTLAIEKGSMVTANGRLFIYDDVYKTVGGNGYYGASNKVIVPLTHRPGGFKYTRTDADLVDAKFIIDGELNCGTKGQIYTTNSTAQTTNHANITSNGGGKVTFGSLNNYSQRVYQIYQNGTTPDYNEVSVSPARLRHGDGTYAVPEASKTFTYVNNMWTKDAATTPDPNVPAVVDYIPRFTVSEVSETFTYVGKSEPIAVSATPNNTNIPVADWADASKMNWEYELIGTDASQFALSGDEGSGTITFTPTSEGKKTVTLRITTTYNRNVNTANTAVQYTYSKDVFLVGNATYLAANTLAFDDLSTLYEGQSIRLFAMGNNANKVTITSSNTSVAAVNNDVLWNDATIEAIVASTDEITITATQEPDLIYNIAGTTITKKVKVNKRVVWNWDILYFGTVNENPITMLDGSTDWTLTKTTDEWNIIDYKTTTKTATIADQIAGKYEVKFTFTQDGESQVFTSTIITNPQHLRVDLNNDTVYRAVTLSANDNVEFIDAADQLKFTSSENSISQWKMKFIGVPDKLYFIPNGNNTWQIEESPNGVNWTTSFPWKSIESNSDFSMSLLPSTRYLRISYGAGNTTPASLKELYITELIDVKSDVKKLYMPVEKDASNNVMPVTKEVVFTYANTNKLYVSSSHPTIFKVKESAGTDAATDVVEIAATTEDNPFGIKGIEVVSTASEVIEDAYLNVYEGPTLVLQIPIKTYLFPQDLPIKLATDKPDGGDRYYYVTTHTHNAEWDGADNVRTITLNNAVSDAAPYLTFEYKGNPTYISFNHSTTAKGTWELEQFINGDWSFVPHTPASGDILDKTTGTFKRFVNASASKLRLIYQSEYAELVDITNVVIVGDASAIVNPARMVLDNNVPEDLSVTAINLPQLNITSTNNHFTVAYVKDETVSAYAATLNLTSEQFAVLNGSGMGDIPFKVKWSGENAIEQGTLELKATIDGKEKLLAIVELVGMKQEITDGDLGISTGVAGGYTLAGKYKADGVTLSGRWQGDSHRSVNIDAAFSTDGKALFDYVVVYGETTTSDGSKTISLPNTLVGSNAKTPCYIYEKNGDVYKVLKSIDNINDKKKAWDMSTQEDPDAVQIPAGKTSVSMYITGFCPYASTGYTKADEGVWYFRANAGQSIDVYLQDCYIYSRAKTEDGHAFVDRQDGYSFTGSYASGTGAVLVFACNDKNNTTNPMNVTIHTLDENLLKSNYGCFMQSVAGRAYQASSPVQIRLIDDTYYKTTTTNLNFTDEWPASQHEKTGVGKRTNGFLSLQKQVNNAPSIDMGARYTVVNFNGGQVELQNAQIVSTNYISSMAICPRSGKFAGVFLAYGMGTDSEEGTVKFNDGTTTVQTMEVESNYRQYYLMDTDAEGKELATTSCLRTPKNTFVSGGSHCMMRACSSPTSKGGAPRNKPETEEGSKLLGLYQYPKNPDSGKKGGWSEGVNGLVIPTDGNVPTDYGVNSVTPNTNGTIEGDDDFLNFWFDPVFEPAAKPEVDVPISFWKTCMTEIAANYAGQGGSVGGNTSIENEEVINLLYCKIDQPIHEVIGSDNYTAPVKNPAHVGDAYLRVPPTEVGEAKEHFITNTEQFRVEKKLYYITTATADVWTVFTAPFDVAKIYVMETYPENELEKLESEGKVREEILLEQAVHNADFASFFGVTIALGQTKDFETIYSEYMTWANLQDRELGLIKEGYSPRGRQLLIPYNGSNFNEANCYIYENKGSWDVKSGDMTNGIPAKFTTKWGFLGATDKKIMTKGNTYSMLLPYCTGCGTEISTREFWDYWSGKFLIFESTDGPHIIEGTDAAADQIDDAIKLDEGTQAILGGNGTLGSVTLDESADSETLIYNGDLQESNFIAARVAGKTALVPTESYLISNLKLPEGQSITGVKRTGEIIYGDSNNGNQNGTSGHMPTVGGGNDLFITSIAGGINVAVAAPQNVRVLSSTGAVIYSGYVTTAVDIQLPTTGIYIVSGENEVQKILF